MDNQPLSDRGAETRMIYDALAKGGAFAWWRDGEGRNRVTPADEVPAGVTIVKSAGAPITPRP